MTGSIRLKSALTHPYFALLCFLAVCFILPRYGSIVVMVGSATILSVYVGVLPESFRGRSGSLVVAICLVAAMWAAVAAIAGLAGTGIIQD